MTGTEEQQEVEKDTQRRARCDYFLSCGSECAVEDLLESAMAFFVARPTAQYDSYYCGCRGYS